MKRKLRRGVSHDPPSCMALMHSLVRVQRRVAKLINRQGDSRGQRVIKNQE